MANKLKPHKIKKKNLEIDVQKTLQIKKIVNDTKNKKDQLKYLAIILGLNILLYIKIIGFSYVDLDDFINIVENNTYFANFNNFFYGFKTSFIATFYRPLLWGSWIIDSQFQNVSNPNTIPIFFHLSNLIYHLLCVWLLFKLLLILNTSLINSFFLTVVFSFHPLFVQAIGWIPGRNDTILTIFVLGSFISFIEYLKSSNNKYLFLHFFCLIIALFAKETAVGIPVICFGYYFLNKNTYKNLNKAIFINILIWAIIIIAWYYIRKNAIESTIFKSLNVTDTSKYRIRATGEIVGWEAFVNNFSFIFESFSKLIFPWKLSVYAAFNKILFYLGLGFYILFLAWIFLSKISFKKWGFAFLWWFIFLIPPMLIYFNDNRYDYLEHRIYTPAIGIIILLSYLIEKFNFKYVKYIFYCIIIVFGIISFKRLNIFSNKESFYSNAIETSPEKINPYRILGEHYNKKGNQEKSIQYYNKVISLEPNDINVISYIAAQYTKQLKFDTAMQYYNLAFSQNIVDYDLYCGFADYLDKKQLFDSSALFYKKAIKIRPDEWIPYHNIAYFFIQKEQYDSAEKYYNVVMKLKPNQINTLWGLGVVYVKQNQIQKAIDILEKAIKLRPDYKETYINLLHIYVQLHQEQDGLRVFNQAKNNGIDLGNLFPMYRK